MLFGGQREVFKQTIHPPWSPHQTRLRSSLVPSPLHQDAFMLAVLAPWQRRCAGAQGKEALSNHARNHCLLRGSQDKGIQKSSWTWRLVTGRRHVESKGSSSNLHRSLNTFLTTSFLLRTSSRELHNTNSFCRRLFLDTPLR